MPFPICRLTRTLLPCIPAAALLLQACAVPPTGRATATPPSACVRATPMPAPRRVLSAQPGPGWRARNCPCVPPISNLELRHANQATVRQDRLAGGRAIPEHAAWRAPLVCGPSLCGRRRVEPPVLGGDMHRPTLTMPPGSSWLRNLGTAAPARRPVTSERAQHVRAGREALAAAAGDRAAARNRPLSCGR